MKTTDFAECLTTFLTMYLPSQNGLSTNTISSYSDTFRILLDYTENVKRISPDIFSLKDFTREFVEGFLRWIETDRGCGIATRNQRLTAIRSFVRYARGKRPAYLYESQRILDLKAKKKPQPLLPHLSPDSMTDILNLPDVTDAYGRRDFVLLTLMYDAGARVQEVCDVRVRDLRLEKPFAVTLTGKGSKTRCVPIMEATAEVLRKFISENHLSGPEKLDYPLF